MLLNDLAVMISSFCEEMITMITTTADNHESELKRFCWQKGEYSQQFYFKTICNLTDSWE